MKHTIRILMTAMCLSSGFEVRLATASLVDIRSYCHDVVAYDRKPNDKSDPIHVSDGPWYSIQYPTEESRRIVFDGVLKFKYPEEPLPIGDVDFSKWAEIVNAFKFPQKLRQFSSAFDSSFAMAKRYSRALCGYYAPLDLFSCGEALTYNLRLIEPHYDTAMPSVYVEVLQDRKTLQGIALVAQRVKSLVVSENIPETRLFEDLERSYRKLGDSKREAYNRAWTVMGMLATAGPNTALRVYQYFTNGSLDGARIAEAVLLISSGAEVLNARTVGRGFLYSLPRGAPTSCDNGKAYHFWMPAYLAYRSVKEGRESGPSRLAAWLIEVGYHMRSASFERNPKRPFIVSWDEKGNGKIRIDLAYAAAGAIYGASARNPNSNSLDLDSGLQAIIASSMPLKPLGSEEATIMFFNEPFTFFRRWNKLFAPKSGYDSIKSSLKLAYP